MNDAHDGGPLTLADAGSDDFLDDAFNRLVDDRLAAADEAMLDAVLAENDAALRRYCEWMQLHAALQWEYPAATVLDPHLDSAGQIPKAEPTRSGDDDAQPGPGTPGVWAAIGLVLLAGGWLALLRSTPVNSRAMPIAQVISVDGAAAWSGMGGLNAAPLVVGDALAAGCIRLEGATALAKLRFNDGTKVEVVGDAVVEFEDEGQKKIILRKGNMSVDAQPQPPGRPMLVRTPTAELEVVGTEFSLSADAASTSLGVTEGRVRFKRVVDGSEVDVTANGIATASLTASGPLRVAAPVDPPEEFRETFSRPRSGPDEMGEWLPAESGLPARLSAVAYVAGRTPAGTPVIHHGISIHAKQPAFALFHRDSVVRVKVRTAQPAEVACMLTLQVPSGAFGGNFLATVDPAEGPGMAPADGDGWRSIEIPASALRPIFPEFDALPAGARVGRIFVNSVEKDVELEVAEVAIGRTEP